MLQGYELWVVDWQGGRAFRPAAGRDIAEVIREARAILAADGRLQEVAINLAGQQLMAFQNTPPDA